MTGQPAAGKSTLLRLLHARLGPDHVVLYERDDNIAAHPRLEPLRQIYGPEVQRTFVDEQFTELHHHCLEHLCGGRWGAPQYDALVHAPLLDERTVKTSYLAPFRAAGYRISVVCIATHISNSWQGLADRYLQDERWVDVPFVVRAYNGMPDTAHALESQADVDDIYVVDRDGYVLFENHRRTDGPMERLAGARDQIIARRDRPVTSEEHERFAERTSRIRRSDAPAALQRTASWLLNLAQESEQDLLPPRPREQRVSEADRIDVRLAVDLRRYAGAGQDTGSSVARHAATSGIVTPDPGATETGHEVAPVVAKRPERRSDRAAGR